MLAYSSRKSHARAIYDVLIDGIGDAFDTDPEGLEAARIYARAIVLGSAQYQFDRAGNNRNPLKATELLGLLENDYQIIPGPNATLNDRRRELAARVRVAKGNRRGAIEYALRTLLGSDFIDYRTTAPADIVTTPSSPGDVGVFAARGTQKKTFAFRGAIAHIGIPIYEAIDLVGGTEIPRVGETYCVDPDPRRNIEKIMITDVSVGSDPVYVRATFTKSHDPGTFATRPHPYWISNKRYDRVVVSVAAAKDAETRRKINELMGRALRGVSQWAICHNSGYFTSDDAVLGLTDSTPAQ